MPSQHYRTYKRLSVARLFVLFIATFSFFWLSAEGGVPSKLWSGFSPKSTRIYSGNDVANTAGTVLHAHRVKTQKNSTCARESSILLAEENMAALRPFFPAMPSEKHSDLKNEGWIRQVCQPVIAHFEKFPLFTSSVHSRRYAISDTDYALKGACMAYIAKSLAAALGTTLYIYAGSHLGGILHGGPIPWDDDIDLLLPYRVKDKFLELCLKLGEDKGLPITCYEYFNAVKLFSTIEPERTHMNDFMGEKFHWTSPYVDIFFYTVEDNHISEVRTSGAIANNRFPVQAFFPTRPYYFAGFHVFGPNPNIARERYDMRVCRLPIFSHHHDVAVAGLNSTTLDCCELMEWFPFVRDHVLSNGWSLVDLFDYDEAFPAALAVPLSQRKTFFSSRETEGQKLTSSLQNLDTVEIVNDFNDGRCPQGPLRVVVFNLERGVRWLEAASMLERESVDIIILNEMDVGMARSDQQHTTRLLAKRLGLNYAWGLEFVELTRGTKDEQLQTENLYDFHGLHGNAVLSRCQFAGAKIFRDPIGAYFSKERTGLNAEGYERRLGGRMALVVQVEVGNKLLNVGSLHKVQDPETLADLKRFIESGAGAGTILGGDQSSLPCEQLGLAVHNHANTWPASCTTLGQHRGDLLCSNLGIRGDAQTHTPCMKLPTGDVQLSDHAIISATFSF